MNQLSERISSMAPSATIAMAAKAREYAERGINVISLSLGEPDFKTPAHICEGAKTAIDTGNYFAYPPVPGYGDLRKAIAEKLHNENGIDCTADNIVVSNGAKHSLANVCYSLLNPGDEVVIFSPFWVTYSALVELAEATPVFIEGTLENDFKATAAQLAAAITDKTKLVMYSSPCNPTGAVFTEEELKAIAEVVQQHEGLMVVADEIYEHINYTGKRISMASLPGMGERTITVNGFAKGFAMTGWRVGYICAPLWAAKGCAKYQGQVTSANSSIAQRAALTAITSDLAPTHEMAKEYERRRGLVYELLQQIPGVKCNMPKGAFYFFPDVSHFFGKSAEGKTINNASELCMYLLNDAHVSLVTGDAFGAPGCVRLSYAASEDNLREAISRLKTSLLKLS